MSTEVKPTEEENKKKEHKHHDHKHKKTHKKASGTEGTPAPEEKKKDGEKQQQHHHEHKSHKAHGDHHKKEEHHKHSSHKHSHEEKKVAEEAQKPQETSTTAIEQPKTEEPKKEQQQTPLPIIVVPPEKPASTNLNVLQPSKPPPPPPLLAPPPKLVVPTNASERRPSNASIPSNLIPSILPNGRRPSNASPVPPILPQPYLSSSINNRRGSISPPSTNQQPQPTEATPTVQIPKFTELKPWLEHQHIGNEISAVLLKENIKIEHLTAINEEELIKLGLPLNARLEIYGAIWLSSSWLPRSPVIPVQTATTTPNDQQQHQSNYYSILKLSSSASKKEEQQDQHPTTTPVVHYSGIVPPIAMHNSSTVGSSKLAPPPKLALPSKPVPKTADELMEESIAIYDSSVRNSQGLISGMLCNSWFHEKASQRLSAIGSLANVLNVYANNLSHYNALVGNSVLLGEDTKLITNFTCIGKAWAKIATELTQRGTRWNRLSHASEAFDGPNISVESWVSSLKYFLSHRGPSLFSLSMKSKKNPKLSTFFAGCKTGILEFCKEIDTFSDPLTAYEEWISRQIKGLSTLFGVLLNVTPLEHPDYNHLVIVAKKIADLESFDKQMRNSEAEIRGKTKVVETVLQEKLIDAPEDLLLWGRNLIEEGTTEQNKGKRGIIQINYFLFNDLLLIGVPEKQHTRVTECIGITTATLRDVPDGTDIGGGVTAKNCWAADNTYFAAQNQEAKKVLLNRVQEIARLTKEQEIKTREQIASLQLGHVMNM